MYKQVFSPQVIVNSNSVFQISAKDKPCYHVNRFLWIYLFDGSLGLLEPCMLCDFVKYKNVLSPQIIVNSDSVFQVSAKANSCSYQSSPGICMMAPRGCKNPNTGACVLWVFFKYKNVFSPQIIVNSNSVFLRKPSLAIVSTNSLGYV